MKLSPGKRQGYEYPTYVGKDVRQDVGQDVGRLSAIVPGSCQATALLMWRIWNWIKRQTHRFSRTFYVCGILVSYYFWIPDSWVCIYLTNILCSMLHGEHKGLERYCSCHIWRGLSITRDQDQAKLIQLWIEGLFSFAKNMLRLTWVDINIDSVSWNCSNRCTL